MTDQKQVEPKQAPTEAQPQPQQQAVDPPKKKSNTVLIVVIVLIVIFIVIPTLVGVFGWYYAKNRLNKFIKNNSENVEVSIGGEKVGVNTSENQKWPTTAPTIVPKYTDGSISGAVRLGDSWSITIKKSSKTAFNSYQSTLASQGWTMDEPVELGTMVTYSAKKSGYVVSGTYSESEEDGVGVLITITKEETIQ